MDTQFSSQDISPDLAAKAQEFARTRSKGSASLVDAAEVAQLLEIAKGDDGRITEVEQQFIQALTLDNNAQRVARTAFDPQSLTFDGHAFHMDVPEGPGLTAEVAKRQGDVTSSQILGWKDNVATGNRFRDVSPLLDVALSSNSPQRDEALKALLDCGPAGLTALYGRMTGASGGLAAVYRTLQTGTPDQRAGALALLQMLAAQDGPVGQLAHSYLDRAQTAVPDLTSLKGPAAVRRADVMVAAHGQALDSIVTTGKTLHSKAATFADPKNPLADRARLDRFVGTDGKPGIIAEYAGLSAKIEAEIVSLDAGITGLQAAIGSAGASDQSELQARLTALRERKIALSLVKADFALDQSAAAIAVTTLKNFPEYGAGMYRTARGDMLNAAASDVQAITSTLTAGFQSLTADRDKLLAERDALSATDPKRAGLQTKIDAINGKLTAIGGKLDQLTAASSALGSAGIAWVKAVQASEAAHRGRLSKLTDLSTAVAGLAAQLTPELYALAQSKDPVIADQAKTKLTALRDQMVAEIETLVADGSAFRKIGGVDRLTDVLKSVQAELRAFDFSKMADINSFLDLADVKKLHDVVMAKFDKIRKSGDVRRSEVDQAFQVQQSVDASLTSVDLSAARRSALANDALMGWSKEAYAAVPILHQGTDTALENPAVQAEFDGHFTTGQNKLVADLEAVKQSYVDALGTDATRRTEVERSPEVQVLTKLVEREKLFKNGTVDQAALAAKDKEITGLLDALPAGAAAKGVLGGMLKGAQALDAELGYKTLRIVSFVADGPDADKTAHDLAIAKATADKDHCYAVVDRGWAGEGAGRKRLGYQVIQYPAAALADKTKLVRQDGVWNHSPVNGNVVLVAGQQNGKVSTVSKMPLDDPSAKDFQTGAVNTHIYDDDAVPNDGSYGGQSVGNPMTSANAAARDAVITTVASRAKDMVLTQYDGAIKQYTKWQADPAAMMTDVIRAVSGKDTKSTETFLKDYFGIEDVHVTDPDGVTLIDFDAGEFAARVSKLAADYNALMAKTPPDEAGAKALIAAYVKGNGDHDINEFTGGVRQRLDQLGDARKHVSKLDMNDADDRNEAAFKLPQQFPTIREELYRSVGLHIDPNKGTPPYSEAEIAQKEKGGGFSSTAELVYAKEAHQWQEDEDSASFWKTVGFVTAVVVVGVLTDGIGAAFLTEAGAATLSATVGVGMAVGFGAKGIYDAYDFKDQAYANVAAGFWDHEAIKSAEKGVAIAWGSAIVQVGMAGVSIGVGSWASKLGTMQRLGVGAALAVGTTAIDPATIDAAVRGDWKSVAFSFALTGVVTGLSMGAGHAMNKWVQSGQKSLPMLQEGEKLYLQNKQGVKQAVEVVRDAQGNPLKNADGELTFHFLNDDGSVMTEGGKPIGFRMKATAAELENVSLIVPAKTSTTAPPAAHPSAVEKPPETPALVHTETSGEIPPLTPQKGPAAEAPAYRSSPTTEGQKAFNAATEEIVSAWPLEKALGLEGRSPTFTDATAEAGFADLGHELSSQQLNPESVKLAGKAMGDPPLPPRKPSNFEAQRTRYEALSGRADHSYAKAKTLDAQAESKLKLAKQFEATKPEMAKSLREDAAKLKAQADQHRQAGDILKAQAYFEYSVGLPFGHQAASLTQNIARLEAEGAVGPARILATYEGDVQAAPGRKTLAELEGVFNADNKVPKVDVDKPYTAGAQVFEAEMGKALADPATKPSAKLEEMAATSLTDAATSAYQHPDSWEKARQIVKDLEALPANTLPAERLAFLKGQVTAANGPGGDPVVGKILDTLIGQYESRLHLSGVTPFRLTRTVVGDTIDVRSPDMLFRARVAQDGVLPEAVTQAKADKTLWREAMADREPSARSAEQISARDRAQAIVGDAALSPPEVLAKLDEVHAALTKEGNAAGADWVDDLITRQAGLAMNKARTLTMDLVDQASAKALSGVAATRRAQARELPELAPFKDTFVDTSHVPEAQRALLPKSEQVASQAIDAIMARSDLSLPDKHALLRQRVAELRAGKDLPAGVSPEEARLAANVLGDYHAAILQPHVEAMIPHYTGTDPKGLVASVTGGTPAVQGRVDAAMGRLARIVDPKVLQKAGPIKVEVHNDPSFRAYYDNGMMHIGPNTDAATIIHEFGHHLETKGGASMWRATYGYLQSRMGVNPEVRSIGKQSGVDAMHAEMGWVSNDPSKPLPSPYMSKVYGSGDTEVLSMGLEMLADPASAAKFYAQDPDAFAFITGMARGDALVEGATVGGLVPPPVTVGPASRPPVFTADGTIADIPRAWTPEKPAMVEINKGAQNKHIRGTNEYKTAGGDAGGRSLLTGDPKALLAAAWGKGVGVSGEPGKPGYKERVEFGKPIGLYTDPVTHAQVETSVGIIHYSAKGAHIVPARPTGT